MRLRALAFLAVTALAGCSAAADPTSNSSADITQAPVNEGGIVHIVSFKFKDDPATRARVPEIVESFRALETSSVDGSGRRLIQSLRWGVDNSHEGQEKGMEVCFVLTFANTADRDEYVDHEAHHQAFKALVGPLLDDGNQAWTSTTPKVGNAGVFVYDFATPRSGPQDHSVFHIVSFRFKDGVSDAQKSEVANAFRALEASSKLPSGESMITSFRDGANDSTEGQDKAEDMTFLLTFRNEVDRDYYVNLEPNHQAFKALVGPLLAPAPDATATLPASAGAAGVFVIDFAD
jgi:hypothetical protein